jgi:hypothetical protein
LQFLEGHDGDEHNAHQNVITIITNTMMILILIIFTYLLSDSKIKLIMSKNNTNNLNENLIKKKITLVIHNVMIKYIIITTRVVELKIVLKEGT